MNQRKLAHYKHKSLNAWAPSKTIIGDNLISLHIKIRFVYNFLILLKHWPLQELGIDTENKMTDPTGSAPSSPLPPVRKISRFQVSSVPEVVSNSAGNVLVLLFVICYLW